MPWSTRELAERAGTTVNTIRHYHRIGLLDEPERRHNGYKQYTVRHLVSLLRVRRLAELGVPLSRIGDVSSCSDDAPGVLRRLDGELQESIERLEKARVEIAAMLNDDVPADGPSGFESVAGLLSETDSSMIHIFTQLYDESALTDVQKILETETDDRLGADFDALAPDADGDARQALVDRLAVSLARNLIDYPWLNDPIDHLVQRPHVTAETMADAIIELYNPAQRDVLHRAYAIAVDRIRTAEVTRAR